MNPSRLYLLLISILIPTVNFAQIPTTAAPQIYCNGQANIVGGDPVYANGRRREIAGDLIYPNGERVVQAGEVVYPNGQRMNIGGDAYHLSGRRVVIGDDLLYPNGQRVQIGGDCFFQTGVRMNSCPEIVTFEDQDEGVLVNGKMNIEERQISDRTFQFQELTVTFRWKLGPEGQILNLETRCDQSLL